MTEAAGISRRGALVGIGMGIGAMGLPAAAAAAAGIPSEEWMTSPRKMLDTYVRVQGDLSGRVCPWRFHGSMLAVTPTEAPRVLLTIEGAETKKVFVRKDGFEIWSRVMTMFRDPETNEVLNGRSWKNPLTGAMVVVRPNIFGSKTQFTVDAPGRIVATRLAAGSDMAPPGTFELRPRFLVLGDKVQVSTDRFTAEGRRIPPTSFATNTAELADVRDGSRPRIEATFAGTDVAPWQGFLAMPERPGNAVWHTHGRKMRGFDELTPEYLEQAKLHVPEVLAWKNP